MLPVIRALRAESDVLLSVDTFKAAVTMPPWKLERTLSTMCAGLLHDPQMMDVARAC